MQYNKIDGLLRGGQDERQIVRAVSELWQFPAIVRLLQLSSESGWEKLHLCFYIDFLSFFALLLRMANEEVVELGVGSTLITNYHEVASIPLGEFSREVVRLLQPFTKSSETGLI